jgi:hypothetical protein
MEIEDQKKRRRRVKQALSLGERLMQMARKARETAELLPPGVEQAEQLRRAREAEAIADLDQFLRSPVRQDVPRSR